MFGLRRAVLVSLAVALVLLGSPPAPAPAAAAGAITTTARGVRVYIGLLGGLVPIDINLPNLPSTWTTGAPRSEQSTLALDLGEILTIGATTTVAEPVPGGARARGRTAGLKLLGQTLALNAITAECRMTESAITTNVDVLDLTLLGANVNPSIGLSIGVPGVLTATLDKRVATYDAATGRLDYLVRGLDLDLLSGLSVVASGSVVAAEATCSGIVKLGDVTTEPVALVPGTSGTARVTVANPGDIAAPNTIVRVPVPPAGYTVGAPAVTGGGTCTKGSLYVSCTGVTVPGGGSATMSLPVSLASSGAGADAWAPASGTIGATSTPIAEVTGTTISATGGGTLATALPPVSTGGSLTTTPAVVAAGKSATATVTVANEGPSDAAGSTVRIPIGNRPAGVSVTAAIATSGTCTVGAAEVTCTGMTVPAGGTGAITVRAAATTVTPPGTTWDLAGLTSTLNGTTVTGAGRLLTVSDPDVNLDNGVTIGPDTAVPGGNAATPTVTVRNVGIIPATGTTITLPAPPAGYTAGTVTTTGGGTCTTTTGIRCTGVVVPAMGTVTVSIPVTLAPDVTASWAATATATSGDSTGTATGTLVTATPRHTLTATATGPAARTVRPGQNTAVTVTVRNQGPSDARGATFVVVAPRSTTLGTPPAGCVPLGPDALRCTTDLAATATRDVVVPLAVSAQADPATPLTGGCVSLDDNRTCGDPGDRDLPALALRTPLAARLTIATTAATITPGTTSAARVRITSTQPETALTVTVPAQLPAGFTVQAATLPGAVCTPVSNAITCTGLALDAAAPADLTLRVAAASAVVPPLTWRSTGIAVSDGTEEVSVDGDLATAGPPETGLAATIGTPDDNTVQPGEQTALRLKVANTGPSDATAATMTVDAPGGTTFGALTGAAAALCPAATTTRLTCTVTLAAGAATPELTLPLTVAANAVPFEPLTGGCVDLDGAAPCDTPVPPIYLRVPFAQQVAVSATRADVTPGRTAGATVAVRAVHGDLDDLGVTVPLGDLPAGLTVTAATGPAGSACTVAAAEVRCTGVDVADAATATVRLTVAATAATAPGTTWTAAGVTVAGAAGTVSSDPQLARAGAAEIVLAATATPPAGRLEPGDTGTLVVTVTNSGPSDAPAARFRILPPAGAALGPLTGDAAAACSLDGTGGATCTVPLAAGASAEWELPLAVDPGATGDVLTGGCVDLGDDGVCTVPPDAAIPPLYLATPLGGRLTVATAPARVVPGGTARARITLTSTQPENDLRVTVPLALPAGLAVTAAGGPCSAAPTELTCSGVDLEPGEPVTVELTVAAGPSVAAGTVWTPAAVMVTDPATGATATGGGPLAEVTGPESALTASVTGPAAGSVRAGESTAVTVVVTNTGPSDATAAPFAVRAPAGATFGALTGDAATLCAAAPGDALLTCAATLALGDPAPALELPLLIDAAADPFVPVTGGCVDVDGTPGCGPGDVALAPIILAVPFGLRAAVAGTAAAVTPGTEDTATVAVTALRGALTGLTVVVPLAALPAGLVVTGVTGNAACVRGAAEVRCTGLDVADGATEVVTLRVGAPPSAPAGLTWTAAGLSVSGTEGGTTVDATLAATTAPQYRLDTDVTVPGELLPGATGTIALGVRNQGPSDATGASVGLVLPPGLTAAAPLPAGCTGAPPGLLCRVDVAAGASTTVEVPVTVDAAALPGSVLTGGCLDGDRDGTCGGPGDEPLPGLAVATPFDRQVTVATRPGTITPGATGTARVTITADRAQTGLSVAIPLGGVPAGITVGTPPGCTAAAQVLTCPGLDVPAGGSTTVEVPVTVAAAATGGAGWTAAAITVTGPGGATATGGGVLVRTGPAAYRLTAAVTGPPDDTVLPGGIATVRAALGNAGPSDATAAPVTVRAPFGTTFGPLTGVAATLCTRPSGAALSCAVTLGAGAPAVTLELPVAVPGSAAADVALTGGCLDLDGDGACGGTGDAALPDLGLRTPLPQVLRARGDLIDIAPGDTRDVTAVVYALEDRDDVVFAFNTATVPAGLDIEQVRAGGVVCPVTGGTIACPGIDLPTGTEVPIVFTLTADASTAGGVSWTPTMTITQGTEVAVFRAILANVGDTLHPTTVTFGVPAPGTLLPGGIGELTVTVRNAGPSVFAAARSFFRAPDGATFTAPAGACTLISATLAACEQDLPVGETSYALGLAVPRTAPAGETLTGGCLDTDLDGVCTTPPDQPIPAIVLGTPFSGQAQLGTAPATVTPGTAATAHVTLTADRPLTGLTATIPLGGLPAGLTVGTGPGCLRTGTTLTCANLTADAGEQRLLGLTVRATSAATPGLTWAPTVTLADGSGATSRVTATLATVGAARTGLTYTVTPPDGPLLPGTTATMTVRVANSGPSDARTATAGVLAPDGTTVGPLAGRAAADCTPAGATRLACRFDLAAGAAPLTWQIPIVIPAAADPGTGPGGGCVDAGDDGSCDVAFPGLTLATPLARAVTVTATTRALAPGATGTAVLDVASTDARTGLGLTVPLDGLPAGLTVTAAPGCTIDAAAVTCAGLTVAADAGTPVRLTLRVATTATPGAVWSPQVVLAGGDEQFVRTVAVASVASPDVRLALSVAVPAPDTLRAGGTGILMVTVRNRGTSDARGLPASLIAPAGTTFLATPGSCTLASPARADCTVNLAGGARTDYPLRIQVPITADPATPLTGGCLDLDRDGACTSRADQDIPAIDLGAPLDAEVSITGIPGTVVPGGYGTAVLHVRADRALAGTTVTVPLAALPAGLAVTGASGPAGAACTAAPAAITCTGVDLEAGVDTVVRLVLLAARGLTPGTTWTATGAGLSHAGETATARVLLATAGARSTAVGYDVTTPAGTVAPGELTTMTVLITNAGPSDAAGVRATVGAPSATSFGTLSGQAATDCTPTGAALLTCTFDQPADGSTRRWAIPLTVATAAAEGDPVAGGCVTSGALVRCGGSATVAGEFAALNPLAERVTLTARPATVRPGSSGTAALVLDPSADYDDLTLTIPLDDLPPGLRVTGASSGGRSCIVAVPAVTCSGISLVGGTPLTVTLEVASAAAGARWTATGILLASSSSAPSPGPDRLVANATLVNAGAGATLTHGAFSVPAPAPGQTTLLPIRVSGPATLTVNAPGGTVPGSRLPAGCDADGATITCTVTAAATLSLPFVVDSTARPGDTLTGGCAGVGSACDLALPGLTVTAATVDLAVEHADPRPVADRGTTVLLRLPYANNGSTSAAAVRFLVTPPPGVTVQRAAVLLDATGTVSVAAAAPDTLDLSCSATDLGNAGTVSCRAPDAVVGTTSELWLYLAVAADARPGRHPVTVTVSTTSPEGNTIDNTTTAQLTIAGARTGPGSGSDGDGPASGGNEDTTGDLARTGRNVAGLILLATMLVAAGTALRLGPARRR